MWTAPVEAATAVVTSCPLQGRPNLRRERGRGKFLEQVEADARVGVRQVAGAVGGRPGGGPGQAPRRVGGWWGTRHRRSAREPRRLGSGCQPGGAQMRMASEKVILEGECKMDGRGEAGRLLRGPCPAWVPAAVVCRHHRTLRWPVPGSHGFPCPPGQGRAPDPWHLVVRCGSGCRDARVCSAGAEAAARCWGLGAPDSPFLGRLSAVLTLEHPSVGRAGKRCPAGPLCSSLCFLLAIVESDLLDDNSKLIV